VVITEKLRVMAMGRNLRCGIFAGLVSVGLCSSVYQSNNPPACAADFADIVADITGLADGIIKNTVNCAERWILNATDTNINPKVCTASVLETVSTALDIVTDVESGTFDCFLFNQGCGQVIASALSLVVDVAGYLIKSTTACLPPSETQEPEVKAFACWACVWKVVKSGVKSAKYIDAAVTECPGPQPDPELRAENLAADPSSMTLLAELPAKGGSAAVERRLTSLRSTLASSKAASADADAEALDLHAKFEGLKAKFSNIFGKEWKLSSLDEDEVPDRRAEAEEVVKYQESKNQIPTDGPNVVTF